MAKGKGRSRRSRDTSDIANFLELRPTVLSPQRSSNLFEVQDRRTYHPGGGVSRPLLSISSRPAVLAERDVNLSRPRSDKFGSEVRSSVRRALKLEFRAPDKALVCVRRERRKEVLHALKKTGRGTGKKYRWNELSKYRCR